jgi:hypothetical protein
MDAISLKEQSWENDTLNLAIEGVGGTRETYWIHVPHAFRSAGIKCVNVKSAVGETQADDAGGQAIAVEVTFPRQQDDLVKGEVQLSFERR